MIKRYKNIIKKARQGYIVDVFKFELLNWLIACKVETNEVMGNGKIQWYFLIMQLNKPIEKTFCRCFDIN